MKLHYETTGSTLDVYGVRAIVQSSQQIACLYCSALIWCAVILSEKCECIASPHVEASGSLLTHLSKSLTLEANVSGSAMRGKVFSSNILFFLHPESSRMARGVAHS